MDFRDRTKLKIAISKIKNEEKAMNKQNILKKGIGFAACFAIVFSGIVYAKDIEQFVKKIFTNSNEAIDVAIENGYIQKNEEGYVYDQNIGIKVDSLVLDDLNLNISFNFDTNDENIKSVRFNDFIIKTDSEDVLYKSGFEYAETLEELPLYNSITWMNNPIKIDNTVFSDSILFGLRSSSNEINNLYFNVTSLNIVYTDNRTEVLEGNWKFDILVNEDMRKSVNIEYTFSENNDYIEKCTGTLSPTGMIIELDLYQEFDAVKYIEDNMDKLNDTGLFYIKYNNELLLPSLLEKGDIDGYKFIIHYDNIGLFFDNINELELYLMPFDTTIKMIEKSN